MNKKFIITGAPGTGKTSIINALTKKGYNCAKEISREIIVEQIKSGGTILPWKNQIKFENKIIKRRYEQYINFKQNAICFFDRSVVDCIAYMNINNIHISTKNMKIIKECKYNKLVFYTPIWKKIYLNDNERRESIEEAEEIESSILKTYQSLDYQTLMIPKSSVEERVNFIISKI